MVWIGAQKEPTFTSRTWRWVTGDVVDKPQWGREQPNNYNGEQNCVVLDGGRDWLWNDVGCNLDYFHWVCMFRKFHGVHNFSFFQMFQPPCARPAQNSYANQSAQTGENLPISLKVLRVQIYFRCDFIHCLFGTNGSSPLKGSIPHFFKNSPKIPESLEKFEKIHKHLPTFDL
jgi:Lectin C-type domain